MNIYTETVCEIGSLLETGWNLLFCGCWNLQAHRLSTKEPLDVVINNRDLMLMYLKRIKKRRALYATLGLNGFKC